MNDRPELALLIGLPASGKTSFCHTVLAGTHERVPRDALGGGRSARSRVARSIRAAAAIGVRVVVDGTHASIRERAALIEIARADGARVVGYYCQSRVDDCLRRNGRRAGLERIPDVGIVDAAKRLERPSLSEGFHELWYVRMDPQGGFIVAPWEEP